MRDLEIASGVDINEHIERTYERSIILAVQNNDAVHLKAMLDNRPETARFTTVTDGPIGMYPLMVMAGRRGHYQLLEAMLNHYDHLDLTLRDDQDHSLLEFLVSMESPESARDRLAFYNIIRNVVDCEIAACRDRCRASAIAQMHLLRLIPEKAIVNNIMGMCPPVPNLTFTKGPGLRFYGDVPDAQQDKLNTDVEKLENRLFDVFLDLQKQLEDEYLDFPYWENEVHVSWFHEFTEEEWEREYGRDDVEDAELPSPRRNAARRYREHRRKLARWS